MGDSDVWGIADDDIDAETTDFCGACAVAGGGPQDDGAQAFGKAEAAVALLKSHVEFG